MKRKTLKSFIPPLYATARTGQIVTTEAKKTTGQPEEGASEMNTNAGHSPLPWIAHGTHLNHEAEGVEYLIATCATSPLNRREREDNAAFICRAANNFENVLNALKEIRDTFLKCEPARFDRTIEAINEVIINAERD
jgi:hypothetical protein